MKKEVLAEVGLSKNEIEVYLKLLELRTAKAMELAKATRLHRPNVYDALSRLVKKGLVGHYTREKTKYYEVVDPEQLMNLLKAKELKLQKIIPELKIMQFQAKPPSSVTILEGIAGARKTLMDLVTNTKELYVLGAPQDLPKDLGEGWLKEWHNRRISNKVMFHHIVNEDYPAHRVKIIRKLKYADIQFLPKEYSAPNSLFINDNGVTLMFQHPFMCINIVRPDVAKSFKQYYKMLSKIAMKKAPQEK
ncbi:hypothetical protein KY310_04940, partial [Candidatus Woesearchaeota archaeon]|nr:hypothetical protein [Candidatus Woesearchaeota archaeon]